MRARWRMFCAGVFLISITLLVSHACAEESIQVLTPIYTVDRIYKSMTGPNFLQQGIYLSKSKEPELLWITGFKADMVAPDGKAPESREFMCHNTFSLNYDIDQHRKLLGTDNFGGTKRLFTLAQGQMEIRFPKGFGIPVYSNEKFMQQAQVLNLNFKNDTKQLRQKSTVYFVRDKELKEPMQPLFLTDVYGYVLIEGDAGYPNVKNPDKEKHGPGCSMGEAASTNVTHDQFGRKFTGHWVVKPGRQIDHTLVTSGLNLPFDTSIHYINVHLHPFAESFELRDLTTNKSLFKSKVKNYRHRIGVDNMTYFSSTKGIPVYKNHEYEVIVIYNNTTKENQDAMAFMFVYMLDKEFKNTPPKGLSLQK